MGNAQSTGASSLCIRLSGHALKTGEVFLHSNEFDYPRLRFEFESGDGPFTVSVLNAKTHALVFKEFEYIVDWFVREVELKGDPSLVSANPLVVLRVKDRLGQVAYSDSLELLTPTPSYHGRDTFVKLRREKTTQTVTVTQTSIETVSASCPLAPTITHTSTVTSTPTFALTSVTSATSVCHPSSSLAIVIPHYAIVGLFLLLFLWLRLSFAKSTAATGATPPPSRRFGKRQGFSKSPDESSPSSRSNASDGATEPLLDE